MPEGPEIWRAAAEISKAIESEVVENIFFAFDNLKSFEEKMIGQKIDFVKPKGKAILTAFDNDLCIYSHNQLYGKWMIKKRGEVPNTNRSLRLAIHTSQKSAFLYSASDIEVIKKEEIESHSYISKLGPDTVDPDTAYEMVLERFYDKKFKNRQLSSLLLDQGFLSGLGNYLRSEILFLSRVLPFRKPSECSEEEIKALAKHAFELPKYSFKTKGNTTKPEVVEALKWEGAKRREYRHYVYGRNGKNCHECGTEIQQIIKGGRKIYYCPEQQK